MCVCVCVCVHFSTFSATGGGLPGFTLSDSLLLGLSFSGGIETGRVGLGLLDALSRNNTPESAETGNKNSINVYTNNHDK